MLVRYLNEGERHYRADKPRASARPAWEFQTVLKGRCAPVFAKGPAEAQAGPCLWVFPPGSNHNWESADGSRTEIRVVHFREVPEDFVTWLGPRPWAVRRLSSREVARLETVFAETRRHYSAPGRFSELVFRKAALEFALLAMGEDEDVPARAADYARAKAEQAVAWYEQHLASGPTVREVARGVFVSPTHLRRLFAEAGLGSPLRCFNRLRLSRAQALLRDGRMTTEAIAGALGFSEASALSRFFRQQTGRAPRRASR